ncbi:ABC transporter ATP-binding protein/permease [Bosea sp. (in: a-proteobacteria)]|uniref:ABC transporter ATP-binding protein/permease n=1 Tax=Bosea sp. (in: a-proteobacteria) TaxID=1871050 RepID=UPI001AC7517B|nr:ABC transporter ATP-binding protein/permease [Bosea sp. (in: a-proteobacteria)]MBN9441092.1 ABC transporter ATP-binding protein/permease [Bosea sp. (in: a-proteobacteria)]
MRPLSILVALMAAAALAVGVPAGSAGIIGMGIVGLLLAVVTFRSPTLTFFLRIFSGIFAIEYVLFAATALLAQAGLWPASLGIPPVPTSLPTTVGVFGIMIYAISFVPVIARISRIASPFFESDEITTANLWPIGPYQIRLGRLAVALFVFLIVLNQAQVGITLRISFFSRDMYNALQNKDAAAFWYQQLWVFIPWATIWVVSGLVEIFANYTLLIRWRQFMAHEYTERWLSHATHYRIALAGSVDNPDQRIAEDTRSFVNQTYNFALPLLSQVSTLVSFSIILWNIDAKFTLPGTAIAIPGYIFWVAFFYAAVATWLTHLIGRPLINLEFEQEKREANFRFSLARLREYSEQIALMVGEPTERAHLAGRFRAIVENFYRLVWRRLKLSAFTFSYNQASVVVPTIILAPYYFAGTITLGVMMQVAGAFDRVQTALSFIINSYSSIAQYLAAISRLTTFEKAIAEAQHGPISEDALSRETSRDDGLHVGKAVLALPNGQPIVRLDRLDFGKTRSTLVIGPSGSGKSTLFRAIAGIWPFGDGKVGIPAQARIMLLPQRPYLPQGTLRAALAYPEREEAYGDDAIREAMAKVRLGHLADRLDEVDLWGQRLSGGEQQRLAVARALLSKPDWLFLDEATASLDEKLEGEIYATIDRELPQAHIVSIGHRATLREMHDAIVTMEPNEDGTFTPTPTAKAPVA